MSLSLSNMDPRDASASKNSKKVQNVPAFMDGELGYMIGTHIFRGGATFLSVPTSRHNRLKCPQQFYSKTVYGNQWSCIYE